MTNWLTYYVTNFSTSELQKTVRCWRVSGFFFELSCARHYNSGSHWTALELSLLDNGIKKKGQGQENNQKQTNPPNTQNNHNQSLTNRGENVKQAQALTAIYKPQLSQRLQQEIVKGQCSVAVTL